MGRYRESGKNWRTLNHNQKIMYKKSTISFVGFGAGHEIIFHRTPPFLEGQTLNWAVAALLQTFQATLILGLPLMDGAV